jgi:MOSC domain-containing protein YiiM
LGGRIVQISVSRGGVPKTAVAEARVTALALEGDAHRDAEHHGGPEQAVCLYSMEAIGRLQAEEQMLLQATRSTSPCTNITRACKDDDYARGSQKRHPGWSRVYAGVLATGSIRQGDPVRLVDEAEAAEVTATAR